MTNRPRAESKLRCSTSGATDSELLSARLPQPGERGGVDRVDEAGEGIELERLGFAHGQTLCRRRISDFTVVTAAGGTSWAR